MEDWVPFCDSVLEDLKKHKDAGPFLQPVDPIALGIPNYPEVIKKPMDLSTVEAKLHGGQYASSDDFKADVKLMFSNCYAFNKRGCPVYAAGQSLERAFNAHFAKAAKKRRTDPPKRKHGPLSPEDARRCEAVLDALYSQPYAEIVWPFTEPITDDQVPGYSAVIKRPTDLSTIRQAVRDRAFDSADAFFAELRLIVSNCHEFNAAAKRIHDCATALAGAIDGLERRTQASPPNSASRLAEIRAEVLRLCREQQALEEAMSQEERAASQQTFGLQQRLALGTAIAQLDQAANARVAAIIQASGVKLHVVEPNVVEIDVRSLSDACCAELQAYIEQIHAKKVSFEEISPQPIEEMNQQ